MHNRLLAYLVRALGTVDFLALAVVFMSKDTIGSIHSSVGLGDMPDEPIVWYLARSASTFYAVFGALVFFVSFDVERYRPLIRFFAIVGAVHGILLFWIGRGSGLPSWWWSSEGPMFLVIAAAVFFLARPSREAAS